MGIPTNESAYKEGATVEVDFSVKPTLAGYDFVGWDRSSTAATAEFTENGTKTFTMGTSDVTLYAVWKQQANTYTVSYDANGGSKAPAKSGPITSGGSYTITSDEPVRDGYNFLGWSEDPRATAADPAFTAGTELNSVTKDYTLYAVWEQKANTYTVSYDANGGSKAPAKSDPIASGGSYTISSDKPTRSGYNFLGWSENPRATTPEAIFAPGAVLNDVTKNYTLYAVWEQRPSRPSSGGGGTIPSTKPGENDDSKPGTDPAGGSGFSDIPSGSNYEDAVIWAVKKGITTGYSDLTFRPDWACTRAQIVTFLWRAMGSPEPKTTENPFTDVASDAYYYKAVLWAVENGITKGVSADAFAPNETCTRGQGVTFIYRAFGSPESTAKASFTDVAEGLFCYDAVNWAVEKEITNGIGDGRFGTANVCTRGHIVTFLYRAYKTVE